MKDQEIIALYISRSEAAIAATEECYGEYCRSIASHILVNTGDVEECINDAYLRAWNSIPPNHPRCLRTYLGRIVRNHAGHIAEKNRAAKRGGGELPLVLEELQECITLKDSTENMVDEILLEKGKEQWYHCVGQEEGALFENLVAYIDYCCVAL